MNGLIGQNPSSPQLPGQPTNFDPPDTSSLGDPNNPSAPLTTGPDRSRNGDSSKSAGGGGRDPIAGGPLAASCVGFKNGRGITDTTITIGNAADISGPVPGLFSAAQKAVTAYVTYFNQTNPQGLCGRKLALKTYDSRTDAGADLSAYTDMCDSVFASVGSMSVFDSGGADVAAGCGLPDMRNTAVTGARATCATCFGAQATGKNEYSNAVGDFFVKNYPNAVKTGAFLHLNAGAAAEQAKTQAAVEEQRGINFVYKSAIDVADFNYGPYVQQMKSKNVNYVQFIGGYSQAVRLTQAMQSAGFKPAVVHFDQAVDDPGFLKSGSSSVENAIVSLNYNPLFEAQVELDLYKRWLQQASPGSVPNGFGVFSWSAAKLFVETAVGLGGKLSRPALVAKLRGVHAWTGGGMHGRMDVGGKHNPECVRFQQVKGGKFVVIGGRLFLCKGVTKIG